MGTLTDFRKKYPQYNDMDDTQLAAAIHKKYYADIPQEDFFKKLTVDVAQPEEQRTPAPIAQPAMQSVAGTLESTPLKDPGGPAMPWDYLTNREAAIEKDRAQRAYFQERLQKGTLEDIKTQTGFFDRIGDLFSRGELSVRSGIKDVEAVIESDPTLKKQFTQEARRFAKDANVEISGTTTEQDVKDNFLRNVVPYVVEKGAESLPQMMAAAANPFGTILSSVATTGQVARSRAEGNNRQDVSGKDLAIAAPVGILSAAMDQFGIGEILGTVGKNAAIRVFKAALAEGSTEGIQSLIEYLGGRVGTDKGADAKEAFEQTAFGALAGAGLATGFRGVGETGGAVAKAVKERGDIRAESEVGRQTKVTGADQSEENLIALSDALTTQYRRQGLTKKEAGAKAAQVLPNIIARQTDAAETGEIGSIASSLGPQAATPTGLGAPTVRVADVTAPAATAAEPVRAPLQEVTPDKVAEVLPAIDIDFADNVDSFEVEYGVTELTPEIRNAAAELVASDPNIAPVDAIGSVLKSAQRAAPTVAPPTDITAPVDIITPVVPAKPPSLKERTTIAQQLVADTVVSSPDFKGLDIPKTKLNAAAIQLANGRQPDAATAIKAVLTKKQLAALTPAPIETAPVIEAPVIEAPVIEAPVIEAPVIPAPPSVDQVATAPVAEAIKQAAAPTNNVIPSLAETAARDTGITEAPVAPPVEAEPVAEEVVPAPIIETPITSQQEAVAEPTPVIEPVTEQTLRDAGFTNSEIGSWRSGRGSKDYAENAGRGFIYYGGEFTPATPENVAEITAGIEARIAENAATRDRLVATDEGKRTVLVGDGRPQLLAEHLRDLETSDSKLKGQIDGLNRQLERARVAGGAPVAAPAPVSEEVAPAPEAVEAGPVEAAPVAEAAPIVDEELTPEEQEQITTEQEFEQPEIPEEAPPPPTPPPASEEDTELARQEEAAAEAAAQRHAEDFGGIVIFRDGPIGLIRAYSNLTGKPVYLPFNGTLRARVDVDSFTGRGFTEEQLATLKQEKEQAEAEDAAKDASDPFVKYGSDGLAVSSSVPENVAGVIAGWKQMLLPGVKLYVTTIEDAAADKAKFTGNTRAVGSAALNADEAGSARRVGPNEYYIAYTQGTSISKVLELLAHEMGHVHEKEAFASASPEDKQALREAHAEWLESQNNKSARDLVLALRARVTGRSVKVGEDIPAGKLTPYWKSFSEWYADQTSRWAVSNEKPLTVVDKFFSRLGTALRNFYKTLRAERYLPTETFTRFINATLKDLDVNPMDESETQTYEDVLDEVAGAYYDEEGPQISTQHFNLLNSGVANKRGSPQELMDILEGYKHDYAMAIMGGNPYEASSAKMSGTERAARKQARAEKDVRKLQYQIARSRNRGRLAEDGSTLAKIVEAPEWIMDFTKDMATAGHDKVVRGMLKIRSDSGVVRSATRMSKALGTTLQRVVNAIQDRHSAENRALTTLMKQVQEWSKFDKAFRAGSNLVTDLANASTLHDINLAKYPTLASFLNNDPKLKAIWTDPSLGERAKLSRIENRQRVAKLLYEQWDMLDLPENGGGKGKAIYKMAADAYMDTFNRRYNAIKANVEKSGMSDARKAQTIARIDAMFASARQIGVYFPLMRFGEFWMRVGTGENAEYILFETERQLKQAARGRYKDMVANGYRGTYRDMLEANEITFGKKLDDLKQQLINDPTKLLKGVYEAIDANALRGDAKVLEDEIFKLYVQVLPQGAQSREFIHRKGRTGFEADAIRAFLTHQRSAASQLARLEYGSGIRNAVDASYSLIEGDPEGLRMLPYIDTMAEMARQELEVAQPTFLSNQITNWIAPKANTIAFVYLMTQTSTAMFQSAQLGMVGLPIMLREYGPVGTAAQMLRYTMSLHKMLGAPMKDPDNPNAFMRFVMRSQPSINDSGYVNKMKNGELKAALKFGWSYANDSLNLFGETFAMDTTRGANAPSRIEDNYPAGAAQVVEGVTFAHNFMTGAMHHMERMSRETMFMSALELEFKKLRKQGFSAAVAQERATLKAAELTREAMFVYSPSSKPLLMRGPVAAVVFQFMSFPLSYLSIISRNFFDMVRLVPSEQGRVNATIMFTGMMAMLGMVAGTTGLPFYSAICGMIDEIRDAMRDEEEPEEGMMDDSNPLSYRSTDLWVRTWLLPHLFGTESTIANGLNLSPEVAEKVQRAAEMGIPSALTGMNMQSPLSADNMLMRDVESNGSIKDAVTKFMFSTGFGAIGGVGLQIADGIDLYHEGHTAKAFEKLTPYGMLRSPQVAARLAEEGYTTRKGDVLSKSYGTKRYDAEYYTFGKLAAQFIGVRDAEVAEVQKAQILAKDAVISIQQDKAKIVDSIGRTRRAFVLKPSEDNLKKYNEAKRKQYIYDIRYGVIDPITDEDLQTSYDTRVESEWNSVGGLRVAKSYRPAAEDIMNR